MAMYEFVCNECATRFEFLSWQSPVCPECFSGDAKRVMSKFSFNIMHEHFEPALGGKVSGITERNKLLKENDFFEASPKEIEEQRVINEKKKEEQKKERLETLRGNLQHALSSERYRSGDGDSEDT